MGFITLTDGTVIHASQLNPDNTMDVIGVLSYTDGDSFIIQQVPVKIYKRLNTNTYNTWQQK